MAWPATSARSKNWGTEILTDTDLENELDILHTYLNDALNSSTGHKHDGTTSEGPKILTANIDDSAGTQGDAYYSSGSSFSRLSAGTAGQAYTTGGSGANPSFAGMTTEGDIEYRDSSTRQRLAAGTAFQILRMNSGATAPEWAAGMEIVSGSYTGDGSSPKSVTIGFSNTGITPKFVLVAKGASSGANSVTHYRMTGLSLGVAMSDGTSQTNSIGTLSANSFQAGSDINTNSTTYYFIAVG